MDTAGNSGLAPVYGHAGVAAELDIVKQIISWLFRQEADFAPEIAPALDTLLASSGKMLRPLFVLLGARLGSALDYSEDAYTQAAFDCGRLSSLGSRYGAALQRGGFDPALDRDFIAWKNAPAFPGGLPNRLYLLAAALELLHTATLIHDDIIDQSALRRGQPTAHTRIGGGKAVLLGDLLLTLCFSLVNDTSPDNEGSRHTGRLISGMVRIMVRSEFLQSAERERVASLLRKPVLRPYQRIIAGKTALMFALALSSGAAEAGAGQTTIDALGRAGFALGNAFQIQDDILDFDLNNTVFGKPAGQDLRDRQLTLPVLAALSRVGAADRPLVLELRKALERYMGLDNLSVTPAAPADGSTLAEIVRLVDRLGGFERARLEAGQQLDRADSQLRRAASVSNAPAVAAQLATISAFFRERRH